MQVYLDILSPFGATVGGGPVAEIVYTRSVDRMDRAGEWYCEVPALSPRAPDIKAKRIARAYGLNEKHGRIDLFTGEIEEIQLVAQQDQPPRLGIRGSGQIRELALAAIPFKTVFTEVDDMPAQIIGRFAGLDQLPVAWVLTGNPNTQRNLSMEILGDNVLEALITIVEATGEHFRRGDAERQLFWLGTALDLIDTGVTATNLPYSGDNPAFCRITSIDQTIDAWQVFNRIVAYGATQTDAEPIDIANATLWPDGTPIGTELTHNLDGLIWTLDKENNTFYHQDSINEFGSRAKTVTFNELRIGEGTTPTQASNMVLQAAYNWLRTRIQPAEYYTMSLVDLDRILLPGEVIRVQARWVRNDVVMVDIDRRLYILEAVNETVARGGTRTVEITAATVDRWRVTDNDIILGTALGTSTSAASIVGVGHTHSQYAAADHTHPGTGEHSHTQYLQLTGGTMTGNIELNNGVHIRPVNNSQSAVIGQGDRMFGNAHIRDIFANLVRIAGDDRFNRGLKITDASNNRGIKVKDAQVGISSINLDALELEAPLTVDGEIALVAVDQRPDPADNILKLYFERDVGGFIGLRVTFPDGTDRPVRLG